MKKIIILLGLFSMLGLSTFASANNKNVNTKTGIFPASFGPSAGIDSPAIKIGNLVFISGQGAGSIKNVKDIDKQIEEAFSNLKVVAHAAGGDLHDVMKVTVYLADLSDYVSLNKVMKQYFNKPYPARSTVGVSNLPKDHRIEVDAIMVLKS